MKLKKGICIQVRFHYTFNSPEIPFFPVSNYNSVSLCISIEASAGPFSFQTHPRLIVFLGCAALIRLNHLNVRRQWSLPNMAQRELSVVQNFVLFLTLLSN